MNATSFSPLLTATIFPITTGFRLLMNPDNPMFETMATIASYITLHKIADMQSEMAEESICNSCEDFWTVLWNPERSIQSKLSSAKTHFIQSIFCEDTHQGKTGSMILVIGIITPIFDMIGKTFLGTKAPNNIHPVVRVVFAALLTGPHFMLTRPSMWK